MVYGIAVDVTAYQQLAKEIRRMEEWGGSDPHYMAVRAVLHDVRHYLRQVPNGTLSMIFDSDQNTDHNCYDLVEKFKAKNDARKFVVSTCFANDDYYIGLQVADLLAAVIRSEAEFRLMGQDYAFKNLFTDLAAENMRARLRIRFLDRPWFEDLEKDYHRRTVLGTMET